MQVLTERDLPLKKKTAAAIGLFDGVHIGHLQLIADIKNKQNLASLIYTFDKKPSSTEPIFNAKEKVQIFDVLGIDKYYVQTFDDSFKRINAENFIKTIVNVFNIAHITVGFDFRFGTNASGDVTLLKKMAPVLGYSLSVIPEKHFEGTKVSSSNIRKLITDGDVGIAATLMGRFFFIDGNITHGNSIGKKLGFPTANISIDKLAPKFGVYATIVKIDDKLFPAVTNVGVKPTIQSLDSPVVESHIINYRGDLYGKNMRVYFIKYLRSEIRFDSLDSLKSQIKHDLISADALLNDLKVYKPYLV